MADSFSLTGRLGLDARKFSTEAKRAADDIEEVQRLWQAGKREAAGEAVPIEIGLHTNLLGTPAMVKDRVRRYRAAGIGTLQAKLAGPLQDRIDTVAQLVEIVAEVDAEPAV